MPTADGCLLVDGGEGPGEPRVYWQGRAVWVARAAWEDAHGSVPAGKRVAHSCHRMACVALEHLYVSTFEEETQVFAELGAYAGEAHWNHKLTDELVYWIRSSPLGLQELADRCGVSVRTVKKVRGLRSWTHL